jgi:hypothetical protein
MSQSWAAKAAVSSPTSEGKALLARIAAANAGDSERSAASSYTKQQLETMRESWVRREEPAPGGLLSRAASMLAAGPPSTSGPGRSPFKAVARVRIPLGA